MSESSLLYTRRLPGGGYVTIEHVDGTDESYRARLRVERRADPIRREGHAAPVIAEAQGNAAETVFAELHAIAANNVSVAQRIQRWQAGKA
jgi:hypothetical protein